ncbi:peptidyl-alpha-hydroxyglycine alpha-amidating lyase 2-like [Vespa velutina]|uniref:peptidyl-alpha-hydroxyglycine alpha-amidating lyase 2-like n=1 Tax=Vespa velutina TaxID=202808 RepID=UPI001FB21825|nr:peptidyl-alpha-hydroxyglycine alpha-amidating lyase 2-like [Vespa velutina]
MSWNVIGQVLLILLGLFFIDDVTSDLNGPKIFERDRSYNDDLSNIYTTLITVGMNEKLLKPVENRDWIGPENLGQISGVSVDPLGYPVVFHRADRLWEYGTFTNDNVYQEEYKGPIKENTVLTLDPKTGEVIRGWGNHTFYLPHGIYIDSFGNVWLTDIALHQVFKYDSNGTLGLSLGQRFEPGNDFEHFCQPTSVAVAPSTGEIYVADGYCNRRIVLFDSMGKPRYSIEGHRINLLIPHSLTILSNGDLCIADRENGRVLCVNVRPFGSKIVISKPPYSVSFFGRVFAVASYRDWIYAVNKMVFSSSAIGYMINPYTRRISNLWFPEYGNFQNPHDIGISPNGTSLYVSEIGPNKVWKFDLIKEV